MDVSQVSHSQMNGSNVIGIPRAVKTGDFDRKGANSSSLTDSYRNTCISDNPGTIVGKISGASEVKNSLQNHPEMRTENLLAILKYLLDDLRIKNRTDK